MPSLLLLEARQRAELLTVDQVVVELDLRRDEAFDSRTTITFGCSTPGASTFCDFRGTELRSATLNGAPVAAEAWADGRIQLDALQLRNELVVDAVMAWSSDGEGLHRHVDPADQRAYCYAMSFLDAAPRWFACFDQPDLKASYRFDILTPQDWIVRGTGASSAVEPGHWSITSERPLSTYFVSIVAGPWAEVCDEHDGIPLSALARASMTDELETHAGDILTVTKKAFDAYHQLFGVRYPFGAYHQVFAPDFNAGAMENPGCVVLREQFLFRGDSTWSDRANRAGTIVHEMAHQWFGDLVTMRWWDDLWLNESFAEYMAHRVCTDHVDYPLWTDFGLKRKDWGLVADQSPSTHPVAVNGALDARTALANFDGISYAKGASVLRQLVATIGDEVFFAGLRDHFARHGFGNATFDDLLASWQRAGARDLDAWSAQWLLTSGADMISAERRGNSVVLTRTAPPTAPADRRHALRVDVLDPDGTLRSQRAVVLDAPELELDLGDGTSSVVVPDAGDETWARIRPSDWRLAAHRVADPATQVVFWNGLRDAVRNAELDSTTAFETCLAELPGSTSDAVLRVMGEWVGDALCGAWCPPAERAHRRQRWADTLAAILAGAAPASDRQLVAWRLLLGVSDDVDLLAGWLLGRDLPTGREMDADLRWMAVQRLVTLGVDPSLVEAELSRDPSSSGRLAAIRCRASVPTIEAKRDAFASVMATPDVPAYEVYAAAEGIFLPEHDELTADLVPEWFDKADGTAALRSGWALGTALLRSFPLSHANSQTLALAQRTLAREDLNPVVRRSLLDATHVLTQAVASPHAPSRVSRGD